MQSCRIFDMGYKEVIDLQSGARLGYVYDAEIDLETGQVNSLIVPGRNRALGLLGREEDLHIPWDKIEKVGEDYILVRGVEAGFAPRMVRKRGNG
ncbi:YlmC/YmxH family sporulation protein [Acidaminobacterium chupaoyuni]